MTLFADPVSLRAKSDQKSGHGSRPLSYFCFCIAALAGLTGMGLGIFMGIAQDFTLAPVHAHVNLLGWVTMSLYGLYHRGMPRVSNRLAWVQVAAGGAGFPMMTAGLAGYLTEWSEALFPVIVAGSLLVMISMALFLVILILDMK
jgi:hypothetical protein